MRFSLSTLRRPKVLLATLAAASLTAAGIAQAADYSTWSRYREVTVNTSALTLGGPVKKVPVLVRFNAADHKDMLDSAATQMLAGGADIRVTKANGTTDVPFEIEHASTGAGGSLVLWVLADSVAQNSATAASFRVFWGKSGSVTMSNPQAVFDTANGFLGVWHMNQTVTAAGDTIRDATHGKNHAVLGLFGAATVPTDTTGAIGIGKKIGSTANAVGAYFEAIDPDSSLSVRTDTGTYNLSAWVNVTSCANNARSSIISKYNNTNAPGTRQFALQINGGGGSWNLTNNPTAHAQTVNEFNAATPCTANEWQYVSASYKSDTIPSPDAAGATATMKIYVNGGGAVTYGTFTQQTVGIGRSSPLRISGIADGQRFIRGSVDEVRIAKVARDSDYVRLEYATQRPTGGTAVVVGATTTQGGTSSSYTLWSGHRTIVLNTSATGANIPAADTTLNFPVLVRLGDQESAIIAAANGGNSIRFSKMDDATALPYQIEHWSPTKAAIWVKVDTILGNNSTQSIRMHWGNAAAASESNGGAVFDTANGYVAAWHMGNAPGTDPRPSAVAAAPSAIVRNVTGAYQPIPGIIGMADSIPGGAGQDTSTFGVVKGSRPYIDMRGPYTGYNDFTAGVSYTIWVNPNVTPGTNGFARFLQMHSTDSVNNPTPANSRLALLRHSGNGGSYAVRHGSVTSGNTSAQPATAGAWMQLGFSKTGTGATKVYLNGDSIHAYGDNSALANTDRSLTWIGRSWDPNNEYLNAKVDNVVLSKVGRKTSWFKLSYQNQKAVNTLVDIGLVTTPGAPTGVTAVAGNAQATVSWTAPSNNGGAAITAYTVTSTPGSLTCSTTGATTCTVTGLTNGQAYTFAVTATNIAGVGAAGTSSSVTPSAPTWSGTRVITMNTTATGANIPGLVTNFPVLVRLGSAEAAIISASKSDGSDIRFYKADSVTPLPHQIETWSSTAAAIWVKVDSVKGNSNTQAIVMKYGNPVASSTSNGPAVFDTANGYVAVWHLNEASGTVADATGKGNTGNPSPKAPVHNAASLIGAGKTFTPAADSSNWYLIGSDTTAVNLNTNNALTITAWVNASSCAERIAAFTKYVSNGNPAGRQYALHTGNAPADWRFTVGAPAVPTAEFFADAPGACIEGSWKHVVGTFASAGAPTIDSAVNVQIYVDGVFQGAGTTSNVSGIGTAGLAYIGRVHNNQRYMNGSLDEITVSAVRRDSNWIKLSYESQKLMQAFTNIGVTLPTAPTAPQGVFAVSGGTIGSIQVSWSAPASNGGAAITGYTASATPGTATCTSTGFSCTITGLTPGNTYTLSVTATNSAGVSPASATTTAVATGIALPGAFSIRMDGSRNPYTYRLPANAIAITEQLTMTVTDVQGKTVWTRTINPASSKSGEITWNGLSSKGQQVSAGMYMVRLRAVMAGQVIEAVQRGVKY